MVAAIEDGIIPVLAAVTKTVRDNFGYDLVGFIFFMFAGQYFNWYAIAIDAKQLFLEFMRVIGDQNIRGFQNAFSGAVVLFQLDDLQLRKVFFQQHQILRPGTAPGID